MSEEVEEVPSSFDESKPHGTLLELGKAPRYVQAGRIYDTTGKDIGEDPNYESEKVAVAARAEVQAAADAAATVAVEAAEVSAAEGRLGMDEAPAFVDPGEEANRENAAALQAEQAAE